MFLSNTRRNALLLAAATLFVPVAVVTTQPFGWHEPARADDSKAEGKLDADKIGTAVEVAVTMGCGDECPLVLARHRVDWRIPDPRDMTPDEFRGVRNLIERKVKELIATL